MNSLTRTIVIGPRDPVIFRDGKPFSAGLSARSLSFAPPSVITGAIRTRLGEVDGLFQRTRIGELKQIEMAGPFLGYRGLDEADWKLGFPAPADALLYEASDLKVLKWARLRPDDARLGRCDLPGGMQPVFGAPSAKAYKEAPAFWMWESMDGWLKGVTPPVDPALVGFKAMPRQRRVQVSISRETLTAEDGMLFVTEGLEFLSPGRGTEFALVAKAATDHMQKPDLYHVGGEGRAAYWDWDAKVQWPKAPAGLETEKRLRLILATPAIFSAGWKPGWLREGPDGNEGTPPGVAGIKLKLRAALVPRAIPISGWDYEHSRPKPTRLMAPAGSVYFFDVIRGDGSELWLRAVCDEAQDRLDGFGRVLAGEWK
jgi:CRISPR-associated protein Cmr3